MIVIVMEIPCRATKVGNRGADYASICKHFTRYLSFIGAPQPTRSRQGILVRHISLQSPILGMVPSRDHREHRPSLATPPDYDLTCFIANYAGNFVPEFLASRMKLW
jgi:hypothetical protein